MPKLIYFLLSGFVFFGSVQAQQESKIDTVLENQNKMLQNQEKILQQVTYVDPLEGKHFGVEFNPALLLAGLGNETTFLSGGFSLFNLAPQAEIAFPVYYRNYHNDDEELLTADIHYRLFFSKRRGFYASAGLRYARLTGELSKWDDAANRDISENVTVNKFGAFFGIGYRYFSKIGIYWGTGIIMGTYFSDDTDKIDGAFMDDGKFLIDVELLKIGYAF